MNEELKRFADGLPERRQTSFRSLEELHEELVKELNQHADRIETNTKQNLRGFYTKALIGFAVLGIACAVGLLGFGIVLKKQNQTSKAIQLQRFEASLDSCLATNIRHDKVVLKIDTAIDTLLQQTAPHPTSKQKQGTKLFKILFKEILGEAVPYTDNCVDFARKRVKATS